MAATWDYDKFVAKFPAFSDKDAWPPAYLESCWDLAAEFISTQECPCRNLRGDSLQTALDLMTAHLATLLGPANATSEDAAGGGLVTNASIGAVSVGMMQPPVSSMWGYWLAQSPYGQALLALLQIKGVGGFYVGGLPERSAFRKVGGVFL
jgi:hypothetical protein